MHEMNMKIILDSSNHESMSICSFVFSKLSVMDSLKNLMSCPILSDFDKYILFCFRLPMIVSNHFTEIGGTVLTLCTPD